MWAMRNPFLSMTQAAPNVSTFREVRRSARSWDPAAPVGLRVASSRASCRALCRESTLMASSLTLYTTTPPRPMVTSARTIEAMTSLNPREP